MEIITIAGIAIIAVIMIAAVSLNYAFGLITRNMLLNQKLEESNSKFEAYMKEKEIEIDKQKERNTKLYNRCMELEDKIFKSESNIKATHEKLVGKTK